MCYHPAYPVVIATSRNAKGPLVIRDPQAGAGL